MVVGFVLAEVDKIVCCVLVVTTEDVGKFVDLLVIGGVTVVLRPGTVLQLPVDSLCLSEFDATIIKPKGA